MKAKLLAVVLGLTAATGAFANTNNGWYAGANLGYSEYNFKNVNVTDDNDLSYGAVVGKDFGNYRLQADVTNYGKAENVVGDVTEEFKAYGLGFSALYDFNTNSNLTPYVGARVSVNRLRYNGENSYGYYKDSESRLGVGATAGLQYAFTQAPLVLDAGIDYNYLNANDTAPSNTYQVGGKVGLLYKF